MAAAAAKGRYGLRDAFARCLQICLVLCFEEEEWEEVLEGLDRNRRKGGVGGAGAGADDEDDDDGEREWVLDRDEMIRARSMLRPAI